MYGTVKQGRAGSIEQGIYPVTNISFSLGFILEALEAESEGIRTHAIKFIEVLVICQSDHPSPPEGGSEVGWTLIYRAIHFQICPLSIYLLIFRSFSITWPISDLPEFHPA